MGMQSRNYYAGYTPNPSSTPYPSAQPYRFMCSPSLSHVVHAEAPGVVCSLQKPLLLLRWITSLPAPASTSLLSDVHSSAAPFSTD